VVDADQEVLIFRRAEQPPAMAIIDAQEMEVEVE
jgi:hypothetical protein